MQNALSSIKQQASGRKVFGKLAAKEERAAYLFLLPWLLGVVFFAGGPGHCFRGDQFHPVETLSIRLPGLDLRTMSVCFTMTLISTAR